MSAYVTQAQLETARTLARCLELADDNGTGSRTDPVYVANILDVITRASGLVEQAAQAAEYALPLTGAQITASLLEAVIDLASGLLGDRRPEFRDAQGRPVYHAQFERGMEWCRKLREGEIQLENAPPTPHPLRVTSGAVQFAATGAITRGW